MSCLPPLQSRKTKQTQLLFRVCYVLKSVKHVHRQQCNKSIQSTLATSELLNMPGNVAAPCIPESQQTAEKITNVSFRPYAPVIWEQKPKHVGFMEFMDMLPPANVANIHSSVRFRRFNINICELFVKTLKNKVR